ncbi:hypothetical protein MTO96_022300 [Rhipicephalus appendiculatus]
MSTDRPSFFPEKRPTARHPLVRPGSVHAKRESELAAFVEATKEGEGGGGGGVGGFRGSRSRCGADLDLETPFSPPRGTEHVAVKARGITKEAGISWCLPDLAVTDRGRGGVRSDAPAVAVACAPVKRGAEGGGHVPFSVRCPWCCAPFWAPPGVERNRSHIAVIITPPLPFRKSHVGFRNLGRLGVPGRVPDVARQGGVADIGEPRVLRRSLGIERRAVSLLPRRAGWPSTWLGRARLPAPRLSLPPGFVSCLLGMNSGAEPGSD